MGAEHVDPHAEPQTPKRVKPRLEVHECPSVVEPSFSYHESTSPQTPEDGGESIFSLQASGGTEVTDDYGRDSSSTDRRGTSSLRDVFLASPTPNPLLKNGRLKSKELRETRITGGRPLGSILEKAKSATCLTAQLETSALELERHRSLEYRPIAPRSPNSLFRDVGSKPRELDEKPIINSLSPSLAVRKTKSADCLRTRLGNSTPNSEACIAGIGVNSKRKSSVLDIKMKLSSKKGLRLTEIFSQMKDDMSNFEVQLLKRPRLSEQRFSTPEKQEHMDQGPLTLESGRIDINFRDRGIVSLRRPKKKSDVTNITTAEIGQSRTLGTPAPDPEITASTPVLAESPAPTILPDAKVIGKLCAKILPSDMDQRLNEDRERCVASTQNDPKKRCSKKRKTERKDCSSLENETTSGFSDATRRIKKLIDLTHCTQHMKISVKQIDAQLPNSGGLLHSQSFQGEEEPSEWYDLSTLAACMKALKLGEFDHIRNEVPPSSSITRTPEAPTTSLGIQSLVASASKSSGSPTRSCQSETTRIPPELTSQSCCQIQYFMPYVTKTESSTPVSQLLEEKIKEPFKSKTKKDSRGLIYIYWQPGNFGHVKIGYSKDFISRIERWEGQCGKKLEVFFPRSKDGHDMDPVEHISRAETLVHEELRDRRKELVKCPGCGKTHTEWFEVSCVLAVEVVQKWMAWMRQQPYKQMYSGDGIAEWMCYGGTVGNLAELCQPHRKLTNPPSSKHNDTADKPQTDEVHEQWVLNLKKWISSQSIRRRRSDR